MTTGLISKVNMNICIDLESIDSFGVFEITKLVVS